MECEKNSITAQSEEPLKSARELLVQLEEFEVGSLSRLCISRDFFEIVSNEDPVRERGNK